MIKVTNTISEELENSRDTALASLIWSTGSIPMSEQAKLVLLESGETVGTIGGGCLEAEIYECCRSVLRTGKTERFQYTMTEKQAGEDGLNCGGSVEIFIEKIYSGAGNLFSAVQLLLKQRATFCSVVGLKRGKRILIDEYGNILHNDRPGIETSHAIELARKSFIIRKGFIYKKDDLHSNEDVFVEPYLPQPKLYIFGGGHVGAEVAKLAKNVGFRVAILDDRPHFANPKRHPYCDEYYTGEIHEMFSQLKIDIHSYILAVTRGHQHDELVVEQALKTSAFFIGMLGSERKKKILWERLSDRGVEEEALSKVSSPVGMNVGADNPEEIAVSILAELIKVRRGIKREWKTKKGF